MKKKIILRKSGLNLSKRTISNFNIVEMNQKAGGSGPTKSIDYTHCRYCDGGGRTRNGNTCPGHNTCYAC